MQWLNEPAQWQTTAGEIHMTTDAKTDFWQKTHYGFVRDNGHFYYQEVVGDFTAAVKISGDYQALYDQCGLMLRLDAAHWVKFGVEYVHGVQQASAVVTREFSDWSVAPLAQNPAALRLRMQREGDAVMMLYSMDGRDDSGYTLLRVAYFPAGRPLHIGLMAASPDGKGFDVTFHNFEVTIP